MANMAKIEEIAMATKRMKSNRLTTIFSSYVVVDSIVFKHLIIMTTFTSFERLSHHSSQTLVLFIAPRPLKCNDTNVVFFFGIWDSDQ